MTRHLRSLAVLMLPLTLAACGGATATGPAGRGPVTAGQLPPTNLHRDGTLPGRTHNDAGGGGQVMGRTAAQLIRDFGTPRLDVTEGPARKLQFAGDRCVMDAYLYAPRAGAEPVASHVDTRSPDGADVARDACIATLPRR
ncbi:hypothetical protein [Sphingomonas lacunae]|nr:hypothetical protein [Sphingomonas lacunae]